MPVKLVRSDTDEANKVTLPAGTSFIGRGTLLQVYDKRVSRKHAEVEVKDDSVIVKALNQNPCFYTKNGSNESQTLNFNSTVVLSNADKIGLLPKSYWFEIIIIEDSAEQSPNTNVPEMPNDSQSTEINNDNTTTNDPDINETFVAINNDTSTCSSSRNNDHILPSSSVTTSMNADCDHDQQTADKNSPIKRTITETEEATPKKRNRTESEETDELGNDITQSPEKHNPNDTEDVKRVKVEPIDPNIQEEPDTSANSSSNAYRDMPPNSVRERCYYGARCYRRNPLHLVEYSHPRDSDWGPGDRGECPYGGNCVKNDPRHWDTHHHPPGTSQLPQLQAFQIQRHGRVIHINPQTINLQDNYTEDSDESNKKH